jgi:hypothetical protein
LKAAAVAVVVVVAAAVGPDVHKAFLVVVSAASQRLSRRQPEMPMVDAAQNFGVAATVG